MGREILRLREVSFSYDKGHAFMEGFGISLKEGSFTALIGANGSGKSTVLKLACGILRPQAGTVELWGKPLHTYPNRDKAKLLSYLPQVLDLQVPFTVGELARMGLYPYDARPPMELGEALGIVGLSDKADTPVRQLSGGERRRAFIAMTLLQGAGIVLLDEPLANLDIRYQMEIVRLLKGLKGLTAMMALHDINLAFEFDSVTVVKDGRVLASGPPGETLTEGLLEEAFGVRLSIIRNGTNTFIGLKG